VSLIHMSRETYEKSLCYSCEANVTEREYNPYKPSVKCREAGTWVPPHTHRCSYRRRMLKRKREEVRVNGTDKS